MAEELPIKYVKDKDGKFVPITSPNAVINEDGKNINELFIRDTEILDLIYPIGSIYMTTAINPLGSTSPASWLGGTWERITDRFLIGAGGSYALGSKGGSSTHTLTVDEMPSHTHTIQVAKHTASGGMGTGKRVTDGLGERITDATGGGQAHNNMPPYLAVYMWKRIS